MQQSVGLLLTFGWTKVTPYFSFPPGKKMQIESYIVSFGWFFLLVDDIDGLERTAVKDRNEVSGGHFVSPWKSP